MIMEARFFSFSVFFLCNAVDKPLKRCCGKKKTNVNFAAFLALFFYNYFTEIYLVAAVTLCWDSKTLNPNFPQLLLWV